jgi:hypothetical protein
MRNLLLIVAGVLLTMWTIGFFGYNAGTLIHVLLGLAALSIVIRIIAEDKTDEQENYND